MKTIFNIIACGAVAATMLSACQMMEDDVFDTDPATRQDNWMADYRRVFNNNEYGWALYTDNPTYGRHPAVYTYAVRFDQDYCTFYNSLSTRRIPNVSNLDSIRSTYSFKMDNGIVLSFDTYNGFFHYYADQSQYFAQDLQSDFEFCLDRYSENEDTIFGRGKTKQLPFMMIKMKMPAEEYQRLSDEITASYAPYDCAFVCAGDTLKASFLSGYHNLLLYFPDEEGGDNIEHMYSYGNLVNGIYMLENIDYKGHIIKELTLNDEKDGYHDDQTGARIIPRPYCDYFIDDADDYDDKFFGYSCLGTYTQAEWDKMKTALNSSKYKASWLNNITFNPDADGHLILTVNMWYGNGEIHFPFDIIKMGMDRIALRYTGTEHSGLGYTIYDLGFSYVIDAIAPKDSWRTYRIVPTSGSAMSPAEFQLVDEENPDNSILFRMNFRYYYGFWD